MRVHCIYFGTLFKFDFGAKIYIISLPCCVSYSCSDQVVPSFYPLHQIPQIFYNLQTSVQAVLLGTVVETDWLTQGIPSKSKIESWPLPLPSGDRPDSDPVVPCLTGDGKYLYVHGAFGLMKVGTGYKNTIRVSYLGAVLLRFWLL